MEISKTVKEAIWSALSSHQDYLSNKACEDLMLDETRLAYIMELKACKEAMHFFIKEID